MSLVNRTENSQPWTRMQRHSKGGYTFVPNWAGFGMWVSQISVKKSFQNVYQHSLMMMMPGRQIKRSEPTSPWGNVYSTVMWELKVSLWHFTCTIMQRTPSPAAFSFSNNKLGNLSHCFKEQTENRYHWERVWMIRNTKSFSIYMNILDIVGQTKHAQSTFPGNCETFCGKCFHKQL